NMPAPGAERLAGMPAEWRRWKCEDLNRQYQGGTFTLSGHASSVMSVAFSPDGTRLATTSYDDTARLWGARTGKPLGACKGHTSVVTGVAFSPDGTRLATASYDKTARLWDARTGERLEVWKGDTSGVKGV